MSDQMLSEAGESDRTKTVYLIRHGRTAGNRAHFHQPDDIPLSEHGLKQAHCLIDPLAELPIDAVLSSDLFRAKETATIAVAGRCPIETTPVFREIKRPTELLGKHYLHPHSVVAMGSIYLRANDPDWHWSDEENVHDTYRRANDALDLIADRPEERIAVFTHRGFIASMLSVVKNFTHGTFKQFLYAGRHSMTIGNASITTLSWRDAPCEDDQLTNTCWRIESVNDRRHLTKDCR